MTQVFHWPSCTFPGCDHTRTWRTRHRLENAQLRHLSWTVGSQAVCFCHGLEAGATFPCDETQKVLHSV